jgi:hypothetical protein
MPPEISEGEIVHDPGVAFGALLGLGEDLVDAEPDVLVHGQPWQQAVVLEHHRAIRSRRVHLAVLEQHAAHGGVGQACDDVEQGRLAATGMADDRDVFALVDGEIDILQHLRGGCAAGENLVDMVELQISGHVLPL